MLLPTNYKRKKGKRIDNMAKGVNSTGVSVSGKTGMVAYKRYIINDAYATAIANRDPVSLSGGYVIACPESAAPIGILHGIEYIDANGAWQMLSHYPASTTNYGKIDGFDKVVALIEPVADHVFAMETSASVAQTDVGSKKRISGTGATGKSTAVVAMAASVTTETRLVEILGLVEKPGNVYGAVADVLVKFVP